MNYLLPRVHDHFTLIILQKLKPTIDPVKCRYFKGEEITQFHQRNQMISENAWNALMIIVGSIYNLYMLPPILVNAFLSTDSSAIIPLIHLLFPLK